MIDFPPKIARVFNEYLREVRAVPGVERIIVYGSWAKRCQSPESDLDIAVFFQTDDPFLLPQYRQLAKAGANTEIDIQVQVFSQNELDRPCGIIEEILKFGVDYPVAV